MQSAMHFFNVRNLTLRNLLRRCFFLRFEVQKKTRPSKDIQPMTSTVICLSNETYTLITRCITFATILRLPPNLKLLT